MTNHSSKAEICWKQRLSNFKKVLSQLTEFHAKPQLSRLEEQGFIKAFEYTFELSWNTIKDFYEAQGETGIQGSRDAFRLAFKRGLVTEGETWMAMIQSRIQTAHTYNETTAQEVIALFVANTFPCFMSSQKPWIASHDNQT